MKTLTKQEAFDAALTGIREQGRPSFVMEGRDVKCLYTSEDGAHCAYYFVAKEAGVENSLTEGCPAHSPLLGDASSKCIIFSKDSYFATELQRAHDNAAAEAYRRELEFLELFEQAMKCIAQAHNLNYTEPPPCTPSEN